MSELKLKPCPFKVGDLVKLKLNDLASWSPKPPEDIVKVLSNPPFEIKNLVEQGRVEIAYQTPTTFGNTFELCYSLLELFVPICQCDLQKLIASGCHCGAFLAEKK